MHILIANDYNTQYLSNVIQKHYIKTHGFTQDWLSANIRSLPSMLGGPGGFSKLPDKFLNDISSAAMIFDEISHKCLLFLHLEVSRVV